MRKIIFLNEDIVDDYVKNYGKVTDHEKLVSKRRTKLIRGGVFTGIGAELATPMAMTMGLSPITWPFAVLAIPFLVAGRINFKRAKTFRNEMGDIADNLGTETLKKIQRFNKLVRNNRELSVVYKKLAHELKYNNPDEAKIRELSDELRNKAREQGIDFETMYAEELSKNSK